MALLTLFLIKDVIWLLIFMLFSWINLFQVNLGNLLELPPAHSRSTYKYIFYIVNSTYPLSSVWVDGFHNLNMT